MWHQRSSDYAMLREAIKRKDKSTARSLILSNASVNIPNARGATPLHWAIIKFDDLEIITMLLDKGANVHITNHRHQKPLEVAIQNNKEQAAVLLIKRGAVVGENLNSLLIKAIEKNHKSLAKVLIDSGVQNNPSIDLNVSLNAAMCQGKPELMQDIKPYCKLLKTSDQYIPREIVLKSGSNYEKCIELLLKWNFTVNPSSSQDKEFVYAAVKNGYLQIVLQLLKFGIDVNLVDVNTGISLLKVACYNRYYEIVENLLKHNARVNMTTITNPEAIQNFLKHDPNFPTDFRWMSSIYFKSYLRDLTCLHIAVLNCDPVMTELLLRYEAKIIDDLKYFSVTSIAVKNNYEDIVRIFLKHGVNVNHINAHGKSLLHFCVETCGSGQDSRYSIAKLLLDQGANIYIKTPNNSLLFEAITNGHRKIAQLFLDYHADVKYINSEGDTPLHKAIEKNFGVEFIKTLLKLNCPVNAANNKMYTPLFIACKTRLNDQFEIINALLKNNANVNCAINIPKMFQNWNQREISTSNRDVDGITPLHAICAHKRNITEYIIRLLLLHNANIEAEDARGWTPLFVACEVSNQIAAKCLVDNHANVNHIDKQNLTPVYVAAKNCRFNSQVVQILLERKVNVHCIDQRRQSIIHLVAENDNAELIKSLAHTQINFNAVDKEGRTSLHIAITKESIDMTRNLIKYGADLNILDRLGRTPLENAIEYKSIHQSEFDDYQERRDGYWHYRYSPENSDEDGYGTDVYVDDIDKCKRIIIILIQQITKLKTAGFEVNQKNLDATDNFDDSDSGEGDNEYADSTELDTSDMEEKCEQEIERMKMEKTGVNNTTFYSLLTYNIHYLGRFIKNKEIKQMLELQVYNEKFPLYMDIIRSRFRDAKLRYKSVNLAKQYFSSNICRGLSDDCIDTVFSYLNIKDIKNFIRALKPSKK